MSKIEDIKIETIGEDTKVKGIEKIETIYPETIELPNYQYGQSQNTLDYDLALRNKPSGGGQFKLGSFTITGTGNITITGVGFTPKLVQFSYSASTGKGEGEMTTSAMRAYDPQTLTTLTTDCVMIRNSGGTTIARTQYVSMDSDGFTVNCSFTSANLTVYYTAFG